MPFGFLVATLLRLQKLKGANFVYPCSERTEQRPGSLVPGREEATVQGLCCLAAVECKLHLGLPPYQKCYLLGEKLLLHSLFV